MDRNYAVWELAKLSEEQDLVRRTLLWFLSLVLLFYDRRQREIHLYEISFHSWLGLCGWP